MSKIAVSEFFGPTFQGESLEIGRPCFFLRLHNCPVQCEKCDTKYTWDSTEKGTLYETEVLYEKMASLFKEYPRCGLVVSGGEPLLQGLNSGFIALLERLRTVLNIPWISLETSGFLGAKSIPELTDKQQFLIKEFLGEFTTVCCSPKVTTVLHGQWTDSQLLPNLPTLLSHCSNTLLAFKFVCATIEEFNKVEEIDKLLELSKKGYLIYLMPIQ